MNPKLEQISNGLDVLYDELVSLIEYINDEREKLSKTITSLRLLVLNIKEELKDIR